MTKEDIYITACYYAIDKLIEQGSSYFTIKMNGKYQKIPWSEVIEWFEKKYQIRKEIKHESIRNN